MNHDMWMNNVIASIVIAFLLFGISTILHEYAHWIMCRVLNCRVIGMKVLFLVYDGKRWLVKMNGKDHCAFTTDDKRKARRIIIAGPLMEIIVAICSFLFAYLARNNWLMYGLIGGAILILLSVVYNLLPMTNGDGKMLFAKERD